MKILSGPKLFKLGSQIARVSVAIAMLTAASGCGFFDYFKMKKSSGTSANYGTDVEVYGYDLGPKAGGRDLSALNTIWSISTAYAPAAIRPDPDMYVRRLLRQYRSEGTTVARNIGLVEAYRPLLGGASQDFVTLPQETYDATSLLAMMLVAETACKGLVDPNSTDHPGWTTILPAAAADTDTNLKFLAQRFIGRPSSKIDASVITKLKALMYAANSNSTNYSTTSYVAPCTALALDGEALLL